MKTAIDHSINPSKVVVVAAIAAIAVVVVVVVVVGAGAGAGVVVVVCGALMTNSTRLSFKCSCPQSNPVMM